jgi:two-component system OmpR family response regulator
VATASAQEMGRLSFDRDTRRAAIGNEAMELSPREWMLMDLLLTQRDKVVTKEQIAEAWAVERGDANAGSIEVYIHRLRRKLDGSGLAIRTVRGLGYLLEAEASS